MVLVVWMLKVEDYEWYTLMEIEQEGDDDLQSQILYLRQQEMQSWGTNRLQRHILLEHHQCSLVELDKILTQSVLLHTSTSLFPEQEVVLYPQFAERVATKSFICDVSKSIHFFNSSFLIYNFSSFIR